MEKICPWSEVARSKPYLNQSTTYQPGLYTLNNLLLIAFVLFCSFSSSSSSVAAALVHLTTHYAKTWYNRQFHRPKGRSLDKNHFTSLLKRYQSQCLVWNWCWNWPQKKKRIDLGLGIERIFKRAFCNELNLSIPLSVLLNLCRAQPKIKLS